MILQPVASHKPFSHKIDNSYHRKFLQWKRCQQQRTQLFNILVFVLDWHHFVVKPSPNSYPVKISSTFKISGCLRLFWPEISTNKKQFCHDSEKCKYEKLGEFSPKSSMSSVIKQRWSQPFHIFAPATRANILTSVQDFFVFKQPIKKVRINSKILWPEPLDSRAKASPAKRWEKGYGNENATPQVCLRENYRTCLQFHEYTTH